VFFNLCEIEVLGPQNIGCAQIGSEDDVKAGEIECPVYPAGHSCGIKDGEENIDNIGAGLFDFIDEEDACPVLGQDRAESSESPGVISNEFGERVFRLELSHVETDGFIPVVERLRQNPRRFGFPDAGWSQKNKGTLGATWRGEIGFADGHALDDGGKDMILAANRVAEIPFQTREAL
jgi:hypothetical protein